MLTFLTQNYRGRYILNFVWPYLYAIKNLFLKIVKCIFDNNNCVLIFFPCFITIVEKVTFVYSTWIHLPVCLHPISCEWLYFMNWYWLKIDRIWKEKPMYYCFIFSHILKIKKNEKKHDDFLEFFPLNSFWIIIPPSSLAEIIHFVYHVQYSWVNLKSFVIGGWNWIR